MMRHGNRLELKNSICRSLGARKADAELRNSSNPDSAQHSFQTQKANGNLCSENGVLEGLLRNLK